MRGNDFLQRKKGNDNFGGGKTRVGGHGNMNHPRKEKGIKKREKE